MINWKILYLIIGLSQCHPTRMAYVQGPTVGRVAAGTGGNRREQTACGPEYRRLGRGLLGTDGRAGTSKDGQT